MSHHHHHHHHHQAPPPVTIRRVALFNPHSNHYLNAEHGSLHAHHELNHKAHFHIESIYAPGAPPIHTIRTHHGHYLGLNHHGHLVFGHSHHEHDYKFLMELHSTHHGNVIAIRGMHHPFYLSVHGHTVGTATAVTHHEHFTELVV